MKTRKNTAVVLAGSGPTAALIRATDWAESPLGAQPTWRAALTSMLGTVLCSPEPMFLWWGPDLVQLYNEGSAALLGSHHPAALGKPVAAAWLEAPRLVEAIADVGAGRRAIAREPLPVAPVAVSLSPVLGEHGETLGVLGIVAGASRELDHSAPARASDAPPLSSTRGEGPRPRSRSWPAARLLLVESDAAVRERLQAALGQRWSVEAVADAASAVAAARERPPDMVLAQADRDLEAFALIRSLRSDPATSRIGVMLRGGPDAASRVEALESGADDYIVWPIDDRELLARLSNHLERARLREDATRRERAARAEAEAANRAKDEFLAMVSHELRAPLGGILIWTQLLRAEKMDEAATDRALRMIERSARSLSQIIDDLLDVSRIITGKLSLNPYPVDLAAVIDSALAAAKASADTKGVKLEGIVDRSVGQVSGDAGRLQQIVANLLANAIKFTAESGQVVARLDSAAGQARISVADNGVGISQDFLPHIFERFRQADSTSTRTEKGLGLGLSISRHLVELHAGTIEAESAGEGHGSTFTVMLPLLNPDVSRPQETAGSVDPPSDARDQLTGLRLLIVDDDDDAREGLAVLLGQWGAQVTAAASVDEAIEALPRVLPDVLISDIAMPGADGYSLIRRVRAMGGPVSGVPAAALTAYATADDRRRALAAGFQEHMPKPIDPRRLMALVLELGRRNDPTR